MERVSYHLERLLPSLQLLQQHHIFTSQELNHLTNQRRSKETNLIRRKVEAIDYLEYAQWESQVEDLRVEKCIRLDIPSKIQSKLRTYHLSHVISIYERGLRRLKYHVGLWKHYIDWAKKMKMNTVVARVVARALSLHPTNLELWLTSSSYELNQSGSADSARTLLQRGIRLNKVGFSSTPSILSNKRTLEKNPKSKKRRKISQNDSIISPEDEERVKDGILKFNLPKEEEMKILHLVLSHIRMELVFIERIRRRRLVLGIDESDSTSETEAQEEEGDDDDREEEEIENEKEAMERTEVPITDEIEGQENIQSKEKSEDKKKGPSYTSNSKGLTSLLQGSIPLALLKDSLGLSIISDEDDNTRVQSTNGLPPTIHYFLFIAFLNIVRTFPFLNKDGRIAGIGKEDSISQGGDRLRKHLLDQAFILFRERYPSSTEENYEIIKLLEISRESDDLLINPLTRLNELRVLNSKQNDENEDGLDEIEPEEESTRNQILRLNSVLQSNGEIELIHLVSAFKRNQRSKLTLVGFQLKNFTENLKDQYQIVGDDFPRFIQKIFKEENWEDDEDGDVANRMVKPELKIKVLETFIGFSKNGDEAVDEEEYNPFAEENLKKYLSVLKRKWIKDYLSDEEVRTSFLVNRIHLELKLEGMVSKGVEDQESWIDLKNHIEAQLIRLKIRDDKEQELKIWLILIRFWETLPASLVDSIAGQGKTNPKKMNEKHRTQDLSKQIEIQRREKLNSIWNSLIDRTEVSLSVDLDQDETKDGLQLFKKWTQSLSTSNFKSGLVNFRNAIDKTLGFLNRTSSSLNKDFNSIASNIDVEKLVKIHDLVLIAFYEFGLEKSKLISNENEVDVDDNNSNWDQDRIEKVLEIIKNFSKPSGLIWSEILRSERNRLGLKDWEWLNNDQENISLDDDDDDEEEEDEDDGEKDDQLKTNFKPFSSLDQRLQKHLENLNSFFLTLTSKQTENDGTRIYSHLNQLQFLYDDLDQKANAMRYVEIVRKELNQSGGGGDEVSLRRLEEGWRKISEM